MDLPQVRALYRAWDRLPPIPVAVARIAAWLGAVPASSTVPLTADGEQDFSALMGEMPTRALPKILTPEEAREKYGF